MTSVHKVDPQSYRSGPLTLSLKKLDFMHKKWINYTHQELQMLQPLGQKFHQNSIYFWRLYLIHYGIYHIQLDSFLTNLESNQI